jgi:hypothetical protein
MRFIGFKFLHVEAVTHMAASYNKKAPRVARGAQSLTVIRQMRLAVHEEIIP